MHINHISQNTNQCSGCGVCVISCPCEAISFNRDDNGFYKPIVDECKCTGCGICRKVCYKFFNEKTPFENAFKDKPVYAAWSKDPAVVSASSSGGVGYELTRHFFGVGYEVCGCVFDAPNDDCKHIIAGSPEDLEAIRSSKYLQSNTIGAFSKFKKDKKYLVIGTPCQIYGLRQWIQMNQWEDNFILVDFFCHGTPSFNLWKKYKSHICEKHNIASAWNYVNFRRKYRNSGWHHYAVLIRDVADKELVKENASRNDLFFKFFLNNSCLNESCCYCKLRLDHCAADIRIADFWGRKYADNNAGVSLVIINTEVGKKTWDDVFEKLMVENCSYEDLLSSQPTRYLSMPAKRTAVLKALDGGQSLERIYRGFFGVSFPRRVLSHIKKTVKTVLKMGYKLFNTNRWK